ncbi:MAG: Uma2 family endonuclease [Acidobacteria bacterium]|jgi:Uma2 family endonuclease|nr:Uma2 family endonuclease [Acidobacteriota bacterium]
MNTATAENFVLDNFTAVDFLTGDGRTILLNNISWNEYEMFLKDFEERAGWRLAYDGGKLEIMPPTPEHEEYSFSFHDFVRAYCENFDINLEGRRSATFRRKFLEKGVEPDECYYVQSAEKIAGKQLPTKNFPVPDVAVEIDVTTESLDKFPIYAALQVPEIWIYDGATVSFFELEAENYHPISDSRALPLLSAEKLTEFLKMSRREGQTSSLKSFRAWLSEQK